MDPTANNPCWLFIMTVHDQADQYTHHAYEHAQAAKTSSCTKPAVT